ncbi:MAG: serine hydrolase domain-containing protein [Planctomycetota bacterium]|jgi:CubicO group peptidase (beta-lactamase class C family)
MRALVLPLLLALLGPAWAGEEDLSAVLEPIRKKHHVPALGGAILRGDRVTAIGATGFRKLGSDKNVTADDLWHLGSCTKSMTATLVGRFVERGKISWDTALPKALPRSKRMDKGYRVVTIEQLLRNRAGVPSDLSADGLWGRLWKREGNPTNQRRTLAEGVLSKPPLSAPGAKYLYSNAGFAIAGYALEVTTKKSWEKLMRDELFKPLGMKSAGFGAPGKGLDQPWGHAVRAGQVIPVAPGPNADNPPAIAPANAVHVSLRDWSKFIALHLQGAQDGEKPLLLKRETLRRIQTAEKGEDYAYGWVVAIRSWGGGEVFWHNGSNTMWFCVVWIAPKKDFAVLLTCNQGGVAATKACDDGVGALIRHVKANS